MLAGGVESMTRAPLVMPKPERGFPRGNSRARRHHDRLALRQPAHGGAPLDRVDGRDSRERGRALRRRRARTRTRSRSSRTGARVAAAGGRPLRRRDRARWTCRSRRATRSRSTPTRARAPTPRSRTLARLRPIFREGGTVTAGNSVARSTTARPAWCWRARSAPRELGREPLARIVRSGVGRRRPRVHGHRPGARRRARHSSAPASSSTTSTWSS